MSELVVKLYFEVLKLCIKIPQNWSRGGQMGLRRACGASHIPRGSCAGSRCQIGGTHCCISVTSVVVYSRSLNYNRSIQSTRYVVAVEIVVLY